jgi:hypothetical protein
MANTYTLLETITVGAAGAASVTFNSIPQTGYTDLVVKMSARSVTDTPACIALVQFNADTGSNYLYRYIRGNGSAVDSSGANPNTSISLFIIAASNATASTFGNSEMYIPNYTSANYKSVSIDGVSENNATRAEAVLTTGLWSSTAAITSIKLSEGAGNFAQYSTFSLYGVSALGTTPTKAPKATGGSIIQTDGTYWYHAFLSSGTFTPATALSCDVLVVAGGGGGGGPISFLTAAGGGGAGGYRSATGLSVSSATSVTVGAGGAGGAGAAYPGTVGTSGSSSIFSTITSAGGGGGAGYNTGNGIAGGSGGGGGAQGATGGAGNTPSTSPSQGNNGGSSVANATNSGGGGGAGAVGSNGTSATVSGAGGAGSNAQSSWLSTVGLGVSGYLAGGGGGGNGSTSTTGTAGAGGAGGGGAGGTGAALAVAGTANTGGGGGGGGWSDTGSTGKDGQAGGSGVVIIRYLA